MLYILVTVLMFGVLIALHEFGHFAAAKLCGVKVNEFSVGMGPQLLHRVGEETEYSVRLLPIGGYCAMEGEEEGTSSDPRAFPNRPWWQRLLILVSGVAMNFLTGLVIILCLLGTKPALYEPVAAAVEPQAQAQGLRVGDRLTRLDGHSILMSSDASLFLKRSGKTTLDLEVLRDGERVPIKDFELLRSVDENGTHWVRLGVNFTEVKNTPGRVLSQSLRQAADDARLVWYSLGEMIRGAVGIREMSGPVGIVDLVGQAGEKGAQAAQAAGSSALLGAAWNILSLASFIAINLAVMNLLPIPALDGGQILFMGVNGLYTLFTRKKLDPKYLGFVSAAGFVCLMGLMLLVTVSDILKKFGV